MVDKKFTVAGSKKEVLAIIRRLVEKFGGEAKLVDVVNTYEKEELRLS